MSELDRLLRELKLARQGQVGQRAAETLRLMQVKVPAGSLHKGEACRAAVALDMAHRILGQAAPRELAGLSSVPQRLFKQTLEKVENMMGVRALSSVSIAQLGVKYGGMQDVVPEATALFERFREVTCADAPRSQHSDFSDPAFSLAAFLVVARALHKSVEKRELLAQHNVDGPKFHRVLQSMAEVWSSMGTAAPKGKASAGASSTLGKRAAGSAGEDEQGKARKRRGDAFVSVARRRARPGATDPTPAPRIDTRTGTAAPPGGDSAAGAAEQRVCRVARRAAPTEAAAAATHPAYVAWATAVLSRHGTELLPPLAIPRPGELPRVACGCADGKPCGCCDWNRVGDVGAAGS